MLILRLKILKMKKIKWKDLAPEWVVAYSGASLTI